MALTNATEVTEHFKAAMDVDYLRVNAHLVAERLAKLKADEQMHQKPTVSTPSTAPAPKK